MHTSTTNLSSRKPAKTKTWLKLTRVRHLSAGLQLYRAKPILALTLMIMSKSLQISWASMTIQQIHENLHHVLSGSHRMIIWTFGPTKTEHQLEVQMAVLTMRMINNFKNVFQTLGLRIFLRSTATRSLFLTLFLSGPRLWWVGVLLMGHCLQNSETTSNLEG